jgi:uncharacterized protein (TIGR03437 family)
MLFPAVLLDAQQTITTIAGTAPSRPAPPSPATQFSFSSISAIAADSKGNIYVADGGTSQVFKVDASQTVTLFAGNGAAPWPSGDGGTAAQASLGMPAFLAVDASGNIYILEHNSSVNDDIRVVSPDGTIATYWIVPDQYNPHAANFCVDAAGNMYIAFGSLQILKVTTNGVASIYAGTGQFGNAGDGGLATAASFGAIGGVGVDSADNVYVEDWYYGVIHKISPQGVISKFSSTTMTPNALLVTANGSLYFGAGNKIESILPGAAAQVIAGNGIFGWTGDGGAALSANLATPGSLAADTSGNVYTADSVTNVVRRVSANGVITQFAGNGRYAYSGDGGPAGFASMNSPYGLASDTAGNLYIADQNNECVRVVSRSGTITTVAGNGKPGYSGDGGAATAASLYHPAGIALDTSGNLYIADSGNSVVRKVSPSGMITTVAGTGAAGYSGDGGPASKAALYTPLGLATDAAGNLYIGDSGNHRVRMVSPAGTIATFAGNGTIGYSGDNGHATDASFASPAAIAVDLGGSVYVSDGLFAVVRKVTPAGNVSTVAGTGTGNYSSGDGGPATSAGLSQQLEGLAIDAQGDLLIADAGNANVRIVSPGGIISTIAGTGKRGYSGDGGLPASAELNQPYGISIDSTGIIYIADKGNNCIRAIYGPFFPVFTSAGLANAASYSGGAVVPGSITSLFGTNLASGAGIFAATRIPLPQSLANVSVLVDGSPAPLFAVANSDQINFQVPWEIAGQAMASIQVISNGVLGPVVWAPVEPLQPGIFTDSQGFGVFVHSSNYTLVDNTNPAVPGEVLLIYATGLGAVVASAQPVTGTAPPGAAATLTTTTVTIGGVNAPVLYSGLAPDFVGLYQLNVTVPSGLTSGYRPVVISMAGVSSNSAALAVEVPPAQGSPATPNGTFRIVGPEGATFMSLAADQTHPGTIYAATLMGVWKSTDKAATWNSVFPFPDGVWSVAVSPTGTVYAGTTNSYRNVEVSGDGGNTWKPSVLPVKGDIVSQVVLNPLNAQTIYALTIYNGLYRSTDGASSWVSVALPATCTSLGNQPFPGYLALDPPSGKLYYGTCNGFYISTDSGQTWTLSITGTKPRYTYASYFELAPGDPKRIYAVFENPGWVPGELYGSQDGGATWTDMQIQCTNFVVHPSNENEVFVWGQFGNQIYSFFWRTSDGGATWRRISEQPAAGLGLLTFLSTSPDIILGQSGTLLELTLDGGASWSDASKGVSNVFGYQVAVDPEAPSTVYLADANGPGISRSFDGGNTWTTILAGGFSAVAVDPFDSNHLLAGTISGFHAPLEASFDGGTTWLNVEPSGWFPIVGDIVFDPTSRGTVYAVGGSGEGVIRSIDAGRTWSLANNGLTTPVSLISHGLAIDPGNPSTLILATYGGIYKSTDGGGSWVLKNPTPAYEPVFDPNHQGSIYAGALGLLKSTDAGETWATVNVGRTDLEPGFNVTVDPEFPDTIFLAAYTVSSAPAIGWSKDGGATWTWLTTGLGSNIVGGYSRCGVVAQASPEILYMVSLSAGLVALTLPGH